MKGWQEWERFYIDHDIRNDFEYSTVAERVWHGGFELLGPEDDILVEIEVVHCLELEGPCAMYGYYFWELSVRRGEYSDEFARKFVGRYAVERDAMDDAHTAADAVVSTLIAPISHMNAAISTIRKELKRKS